MKVKVNKTVFDEAEWGYDPNEGVGRLLITTEQSIFQLIESFGEGNDIEVYDDNVDLTTKWYGASLKSITVTPGEPRQVSSLFKVTILENNAEKVLKGGVEDDEDAILELAEMIGDMEKAKKDQDKDFEKMQKEFDDTKRNVDAMQEGLNNIRNRVENVPHDILERFDTLWKNYNTLADRVARLENGGK